MNSLATTDQYAGYAYAYPHKTAYAPLDPVRKLPEIWADDPKTGLFLYLHVPFCEMRCGFCNLFTMANPAFDLVERYIDAIARQAQQTRDALGAPRFARRALGGGTPTFLNAAQLDRLLGIARDVLGADGVPTSVETSPRTATPQRLQVLAEHGVTRISIGIQSFVEDEARAAGRAQRSREVHAALDAIRRLRFPILNVDLIYGLPRQTQQSWRASLQRALEWAPEEIYAYPLYVRPETGMHGSVTHGDVRAACYRDAVDFLGHHGYRQTSMRMFTRMPDRADVGYCCQEDGMVGLGPGARSYTRSLHYATRYAVRSNGVRQVVDEWLACDDFETITHGFVLDDDEQRRRWLLQSLLQAEGLEEGAYRLRFGTRLLDDFPRLCVLTDHGLATREAGRFGLTAAGLEASDQIGPWLYSPRVHQKMQEFVPG